MPKPCCRCNFRNAKPGERFCPKCRKDVLQLLRNSSYLTPAPSNPHTSRRTQDQREITHETKFGPTQR